MRIIDKLFLIGFEKEFKDNGVTLFDVYTVEIHGEQGPQVLAYLSDFIEEFERVPGWDVYRHKGYVNKFRKMFAEQLVRQKYKRDIVKYNLKLLEEQ